MQDEKDNIMRPTDNNTSENIVSEYTVEERETVKDIENKLGISWQEIISANGDLLKNDSDITPGMRLRIPSKK